MLRWVIVILIYHYSGSNVDVWYDTSMFFKARPECESMLRDLKYTEEKITPIYKQDKDISHVRKKCELFVVMDKQVGAMK